MVLGGDGAVIMLVLAGLLLVGQFRTDIGSDSGLVELFLLVEKFFLFFFGFLFVEALPLPFVNAAGKCPWTAAHGADEGYRLEEVRNGSGTFSKENGIHFCNHGSGRGVIGFLGFKVAGEIGTKGFLFFIFAKWVFTFQFYFCIPIEINLRINFSRALLREHKN